MKQGHWMVLITERFINDLSYDCGLCFPLAEVYFSKIVSFRCIE